MEDIYDDLDNYNEVNCIQELRTENTELKVKLEEHATALEKLQRDYDTLASEFKKLENNYSSLLKTARSEIERKTQRITQLNKEKDMMVINAVQKGIPIKRHFNKSNQAPNHLKISTEKPSGNKKVKEDFNAKNIDGKNERFETQSKDNVPILGPSNKSDNHKAKEMPRQHKTEHNDPPATVASSIKDRRKSIPAVAFETQSKDNVPILGPSNKSDNHKAKEIPRQHKTEHNDPPATVASSIKDRRKSIPAVSMPHDKFSSEDEFDQNNPAKSNRDIPTSTKFEKRNINRLDRQANRSETSSIEDRNLNYRETSRNYHDCSKEGYKGGRPTRPYDKSSYRGRDKYESSRYRKHYSPERVAKRPQRDFKDDYPRQEHGRYRTPESPPHELFSRYHQRNEDPHSSFDRQAHDYEKHRPSYEERFALKHRLSTNHDEQHSKRQRTEYFGNPDIHFKGDRNKPAHSHDLMDKQRTTGFSPDEYENLRATCQSPDYVHSDSAVIKPKEIMATAATPLDDPRVTSKKYVVIKENGKEILSTSAGRNVDIKPVDKIVWKIKPIDIPVALVRRPSQCSEVLVNDINYLTNISIESGELCFESDHENRESNKVKEIHHTKNNTTNSAQQETNVDKCEKSIIKYKIPKVGQNNQKSESKLNVPVIEVGDYVAKIKNVTDKVVIASSSKKKVTDKIDSYEHENVLTSNKVNNINKTDKDDCQNLVSLSSIAIVADDLELSDENSDNVDTHKQVTEKVMNQIKEQSKITEAKKDVSKNKIINNPNTQQEKVTDNICESVLLPNEHEKSKESDSTKKHNSKKKRTKFKEGSSKDLLKTTDTIQGSEKKTKPKHEKDCKSKENHNKFSDLFGDTSSSLMTPEDLGLPSYLPICENALDMKIDDIIDVQTHKISDCPDVKSKPIKPAEQITIPKKIIMENKIQHVLQKSNTEDKEVSEKEHQIYSNVKPLSDMYKNLNSETDSNEPGVVQTVIISKGLQQQYDDSNAAVMEKPDNDVTDCNQIQAMINFKKQDLKALATSTPHKELSDLKIGTETVMKDFTNNSNNNIVKSPDSNVQAINQSQPTALDSQDAPDVRIFVKRRRKVVKQAPVT